MSDIPHIIFALHDKVVHSSQTVETNSYVNRHIKTYYGGILEVRSIDIFKKYDLEALKYI